jgi:hypothetical protein
MCQQVTAGPPDAGRPAPAALQAATAGLELSSQFLRRLSMLITPAPKAAIWSSPPAIITFFRKWIIWFWSAKSPWNETAVASEKRASPSATGRTR